MNSSAHPSSSRLHRAIETLEHRRLLSASWTTVDNVPPPTGSYTWIDSMAADGTGNVYAAGVSGGSGLLREKPAGSSGFVTLATPATGELNSVGTDAARDVFITDGARIFEQPAGQSGFAPVNVNVPAGSTLSLYDYQTFAADAAGDVFAVGNTHVPTGTTTTGRGANQKTVTTYTDYGTLFELKAGQTSFTPVYQSTTFLPVGIAVIDGVASAGVYVIDAYSSGWLVRRSTDGGASWTTSGGFRYDPNLNTFASNAYAIAADASGNGNVYVVGSGEQRVQTGVTYTKVKGQLVAQPVYSYYYHWLTRQSSDGGATWTSVDDYQQGQSGTNTPYAMADVAGVLYVAGQGTDGVVRSNVGGTWQTADDYADDGLGAVAIDPTSGAAYAGAYDSWVIRSNATPIAPPATALFSSLAITQRPADDILGGSA